MAYLPSPCSPARDPIWEGDNVEDVFRPQPWIIRDHGDAVDHQARDERAVLDRELLAIMHKPEDLYEYSSQCAAEKSLCDKGEDVSDGYVVLSNKGAEGRVPEEIVVCRLVVEVVIEEMLDYHDRDCSKKKDAHSKPKLVLQNVCKTFTV